MGSIKNKKQKNKKLGYSFIILASVLLFGTMLFLMLGRGSSQDKEMSENDSSSVKKETINYGPATQDEAQSSNNNKSQEVKPQTETQSSPQTNKNLSIIVTSSDAINIRAQVSGVVEDGGICTAVYKRAGETYEKSSEGLASVSYTQCSVIRPDSGALSGGEWTVFVKYTSTSGSGTSAEFKVKV